MPTKKITPKAKKEHGIRELSDVILVVGNFIYAFYASMDDKKFSIIADLRHFFGALKNMPAAIRGINKVPAEIKDLDADEIDELKAFIIKNFRLPDSKKEARAEEMIKISLDTVSAVMRIFA